MSWFSILPGAGRRQWLRLARLCCVAVSAVLTLSASAFADASAPNPNAATSGIAGYWHIDGRLAGNGIHVLCHFDRAVADFSGLCFGDGTSAAGNFAGGRTVWRWKAGNHFLTFDGMLGPDGVLAGKVSTVAFAGIPVVGTFSAQRPATDLAGKVPPQGLVALKEIIGDLARGELPTESCTAEFADGLRKQMGALQAAYGKLGAVKSISYVDSLRSPKLTTEIYEVHFAGTKRICSIDVTKAGKLSDLICAGE